MKQKRISSSPFIPSVKTTEKWRERIKLVNNSAGCDLTMSGRAVIEDQVKILCGDNSSMFARRSESEVSTLNNY